MPALPRGVYDVGPVRLREDRPGRPGDAGGSRPGTPCALIVAPRVTDLSLFAGGLTNDLDGATSQQLSMSDLAFHALREYVPGDDLRHVHWRSSAKAGELLVRQYHETRRGHVTVLVDPATSLLPAVAGLRAGGLGGHLDRPACGARRLRHLPAVRCRTSARGRTAVAMTDTACFFAAGDDDYLAVAADAAAAVPGTGLVVQVTGGARPLAELDAAAGRFDRGADWLVVRADSEAEADPADSHDLREISVPDLTRLRELLARGLR